MSSLNERASRPDVDYVREEILYALARCANGIRIIPVLVGDASMPTAIELAEVDAELVSLSELHAHIFVGTHTDRDEQFKRLRDSIAAVLGMPLGIIPKERRQDRSEKIVFIAGMFRDLKQIRKIAAELGARGFLVDYFDSQMWAINDAAWQSVFVHRVQTSGCVVMAVFGDPGQALQWEMEQAVRLGVPAIPVLFDVDPGFFQQLDPRINCLLVDRKGMRRSDYDELERAIRLIMLRGL